MANRRVVITGIALAGSIGVGNRLVWNRLLNGESQVTIVGKGDPRFKKIPPLIGGTIPRGVGPGKLDEESIFSELEKKKYPLHARLGLAVADLALNDAGYSKHMLDNLPEDEKDRMGVIAGCTVPEFEDMVELATTLKTEGFDKTNPYISSKLMHQCLPTLLSIRYGLTGPNTSVMTACSTSLHAVGDSFRMIRDGCADFILATGVHPYLTPGIIAGFMRANAVCMKFQDDPKAGSRPFDRERSGIVPSEATGAVILEEFEKAKARGAHIYSEILGYGASGDAHHALAPRRDGLGAYNAMARALNDAKISPEKISYINAHAGSTQLGDAAENLAILQLFGRSSRLAVSGTKGTTGHMMNAAGITETIITALALKTKELPPTINLHNLDSLEDFPLNYVPNEAQQLVCDGLPVGLNNSFGMGGSNASLCLGAI